MNCSKRLQIEETFKHRSLSMLSEIKTGTIKQVLLFRIYQTKHRLCSNPFTLYWLMI
jgi:hypothetical protein